MSSRLTVFGERQSFSSPFSLCLSAHHQVLVEPEPPSAQRVHGVDLVGGEEQGRPLKSEEQQKNYVHEWERVQRALYRKKEYQTCQRWSEVGGLLTIFGKTSATSEEHVSKSFPESEEEEEEEEEQQVRRSEINTDMPSEDWYIEKLVQELKDGDQTATVLILCAMMELDLLKESYQVAIQDLGGLEVLLNLLDTDDIRCKIGSLKILTKISQNVQLRQTIVKMRGLQRMVNNLDLPVKELQALAAETIKNVATSRRARRIVREHGGIGKLVKLLECFSNPAERRANMEEDLEVARCAASALWICSKSTKNKEAIRSAGGIPLLGRMLRSPLENMLVPVVGTLQECASQEAYRAAIQSEGMVKVFVKKLKSNNTELQMLCASAIFKCAEDEGTRDLVRRSRGLQPLVSLLAKADNKQLLAAATGAIWKCSLSMENVAIFQENNVLQILIGLLTDQPEEVLVNVVGALGQFAQIPANTTTICRGGSIKILINLLKGTNQALLVNVAKAVGACATVKDNVEILFVLDGIHLLWSLLQNPSAEVQCSAAWALCPCIGNAKNAEIMALSLIGGLELVVNLLKSTNNQVLTSVCALVAKLAKHQKIVEVLSERGAVPLLTRLTDTTDNRLRCYLAEAIEHLCLWSTNRESFGECGAVGPLVRYLKSKDSRVLLSATMALYELSKEPNNIITMHKEGAVPQLIRLIGSDDHKLQEFAAGCLRNIRLLARANQRAAR
uniref:Outer dynein arm docking complex subunit 2 n=2 Tax=Cyprinodon variegatus TaxID=28743 RepID=A0A3Q2CZ47_CYPVA